MSKNKVGHKAPVKQTLEFASLKPKDSNIKETSKAVNESLLSKKKLTQDTDK